LPLDAAAACRRWRQLPAAAATALPLLLRRHRPPWALARPPLLLVLPRRLWAASGLGQPQAGISWMANMLADKQATFTS
jgi:hypothetical protein